MTINDNDKTAEKQKTSRRRRERSSSSLDDIFGPVQLLKTEDPKKFNLLHNAVSKLVQPRDLFEQIWVREIAHDVWEAQRLRRLKALYWNKAAFDTRIKQENQPEFFSPRKCEEEDGKFYRTTNSATNGQPREGGGGDNSEHHDVFVAEKEGPGLEDVDNLTVEELAAALSQNVNTLDKIDGRISTLAFIRISIMREIDHRRASQGRVARPKRVSSAGQKRLAARQ